MNRLLALLIVTGLVFSQVGYSGPGTPEPTPETAPSQPTPAPVVAVPATSEGEGLSCPSLVGGGIDTILARHRAVNEAGVKAASDATFDEFLNILGKYDPVRGRLEIQDQVSQLIARKRPTFGTIQDSGMAMKDLANAGKLGRQQASIITGLRIRTARKLIAQSGSLLDRWFGWVPFLRHPSILWQVVQDRSRDVQDVLNDIDLTVQNEFQRTDEIKGRHDKRMKDLAAREHACEDYAQAMEANAKRIRTEVQSRFPADSQEHKLFGIIAQSYDEEANRYYKVTERYAEAGQKGDALTLFIIKFKQILDTEAMLAKASLEGGSLSAEASGQLDILAQMSVEYRRAANEADAAFAKNLKDTATTLAELSRDHSADRIRIQAEADFQTALQIRADVERDQIENMEARRQAMKDKITGIRNSEVTLKVSAEEALATSGLVNFNQQPMIGSAPLPAPVLGDTSGDETTPTTP